MPHYPPVFVHVYSFEKWELFVTATIQLWWAWIFIQPIVFFRTSKIFNPTCCQAYVTKPVKVHREMCIQHGCSKINRWYGCHSPYLLPRAQNVDFYSNSPEIGGHRETVRTLSRQRQNLSQPNHIVYAYSSGPTDTLTSPRKWIFIQKCGFLFENNKNLHRSSGYRILKTLSWLQIHE